MASMANGSLGAKVVVGLVGLREKRGPPRPIPVPDAAPDLAAGDLAAVFADLERRLES